MTPRVREEWRARIAAEYTSAAITQHLVLWLIQAGAPPDLIEAGLAIVAVPLFRHLRERCTETAARAALDRILRDEVRHRDFGWDLLDWLVALEDGVPERVTAELPGMLAELEASYGTANHAIAADDGAMTAGERAWGLAPPREYAEILARTIERDFVPRFAARDIRVPGAAVTQV